MLEKRHHLEKGSYRQRSRFTLTYRLKEGYLPGMHFRVITAPVTIQNDQASWVQRERQPRYDRR